MPRGSSVLATASPENSERRIAHSRQPFPLLRQQERALHAASRVTAHAEEIICRSSFPSESLAGFSRAVTQMKTYRGPAGGVC